MKFLAIGDLHGRYKALARIDYYAKTRGIDLVIQLGDLGVHWPGERSLILEYFNKKNNFGIPTWISCLGNHDNWNKYLEKAEKHSGLLYYAPRLFVARRNHYIWDFGGMLFLGGAVSADVPAGVDFLGQYQPARVIDKDWWSLEVPSHQDFQVFMDLLEERKPRFVFTHDAPTVATGLKSQAINPLSNLPVDYVAHQLQNCWTLSDHKPDFWFYGHHHNLRITHSDTTTFHCTGLHGQGVYVSDNIVVPVNFTSKFKLIDIATGLKPCQ